MDAQQLLDSIGSLPAGSMLTLANSGGQMVATYRINAEGNPRSSVSARGVSENAVDAINAARDAAIAKQ